MIMTVCSCSVAILLTAGLGLSILAGDVKAGTYVYRDKDGNEVRELPRAERRTREAEEGQGGTGKTSRRRIAGESPATVIVEKIGKPPGGAQR